MPISANYLTKENRQSVMVERLTGNQKVMGSIPVGDSEVFSSEKKKLVSTRTFLL